MDVECFVKALGADFYTGVPDSQLRSLCDYLMDAYALDPKHHIIAANEGNSVAIAAGYNLSTGKVPVAYMQNSGEGNIVNPVASLLNGDVYSIPCIFVVGWRGRPGVHDEPQHVFQGKITESLMHLMQIETMIVSKDTKEGDISNRMRGWSQALSEGRQVAFIIEKDALTYVNKVKYSNDFKLVREEVIERIAEFTEDCPVVSTTGKISRELFEIRERKGQPHKYDFLTVGSMGHCSSIALGVAINTPSKKVWCIDGDGAAIMHMGAMGTIASVSPSNMVHILLNNQAHETVGGMPTVSRTIDYVSLAKSCGYPKAFTAETAEELDIVLKEAKRSDSLVFVEVRCALGSRKDLGRPTLSAKENKVNFERMLQECR